MTSSSDDPTLPPAPAARLSASGDSPYRRERDRELAEAGWTRRFVGAPPRLQEMVELYETLGQDVLLDDLSPVELAAECDGCTLALSLFRVVYTRRSQ